MAKPEFTKYTERLLEVEAYFPKSRERFTDHKGIGRSCAKGDVVVKNPHLPGTGIEFMKLDAFNARYGKSEEEAKEGTKKLRRKPKPAEQDETNSNTKPQETVN